MVDHTRAFHILECKRCNLTSSTVTGALSICFVHEREKDYFTVGNTVLLVKGTQFRRNRIRETNVEGRSKELGFWLEPEREMLCCFALPA